MPWYRRPPAWLAEGMKPQPSVYIRAMGGVMRPVSRSHRHIPRVSEGQEAGSTAMIRGLALPVSLSCMKGAMRPPQVGAAAGAAHDDIRIFVQLLHSQLAFRPMTDWCSNTWFKTPRTYRYPFCGYGFFPQPGNSAAQAAGGSGMLLQDFAPGVGGVAREGLPRRQRPA